MKIKLQISDYCTIARKVPSNTKVKKTNTLNEMVKWMDLQGFKRMNDYYENDSFNEKYMLKTLFLIGMLFICLSCSMQVQQEESENKIDVRNLPVPSFNIDFSSIENDLKKFKELSDYSFYSSNKDMYYSSFCDYIYNKITYKLDINNYNINEYWDSPLETWNKKSGDCEDIAILTSYLFINKLNIDKNIIRIVTSDCNDGANHAFIQVIIKDKWINFLLTGTETYTNIKYYTYEQALKIAYYTHNPKNTIY